MFIKKSHPVFDSVLVDEENQCGTDSDFLFLQFLNIIFLFFKNIFHSFWLKWKIKVRSFYSFFFFFEGNLNSSKNIFLSFFNSEVLTRWCNCAYGYLYNINVLNNCFLFILYINLVKRLSQWHSRSLLCSAHYKYKINILY